MAESIQRTLTRVRPPRVRITYDVETGDAIIKKELPFVLGIMADLSGHALVPREHPLPPYKERPFVFIDRDNFDDVLADAMPALQLSGAVKAQLHFSCLEDFAPARVVERIAPLKALLDARNRLQDLAAKLDGNDAAHDALVDLLKQDNLSVNMQKSIQEMQARRGELQSVVDARVAAQNAASQTSPQADAPEAPPTDAQQQENSAAPQGETP